MEIIKITFKSYSGFCPREMSFTDKLTITPTSISYKRSTPNISPDNMSADWTYKTYNHQYITIFNRICEELSAAIKAEPKEKVFVTDICEVDIAVTYADKTKKTYSSYCFGKEFDKLFNTIKILVPPIESMPSLIPYEEEED